MPMRRRGKGLLARVNSFPNLASVLQPNGGAPNPQRAVRFSYNIATNSWTQEECTVRLENIPFAEGGMRWCVKMQLSQPGGAVYNLVAKIIKPDIIPPEAMEKAYFDEVMTQTICNTFAQEFNKRRVIEDGEVVNVQFLPVSVVQLVQSGGRLVNVESVMDGNYVKHNDNDGNISTSALVPQAFSHFTWEASKHNLLVCDIQGVENFFTDPQIHSADGFGFGIGNRGQEGIRNFLQTHVCNDVCCQLGVSKSHQGQHLRPVSGMKELLSQCGSKYNESAQTAVVRATRTREVYDDSKAELRQSSCEPSAELHRASSWGSSTETASERRVLSAEEARSRQGLPTERHGMKRSITFNVMPQQQPERGRELSAEEQERRAAQLVRQQRDLQLQLELRLKQRALHQQIHATSTASSPSSPEAISRPVSTERWGGGQEERAVPAEMAQQVEELRERLERLRAQHRAPAPPSPPAQHSSSVSCRFCGVEGFSEQRVAEKGSHHRANCPRRAPDDADTVIRAEMELQRAAADEPLLAKLHSKRELLKLQLAEIAPRPAPPTSA